jgi:hypothetical protein
VFESIQNQISNGRGATRISALIPDIQNEKLREEGAGHKTAIPSLGSAVCDSPDVFSPKVAGRKRRRGTGSPDSTRRAYHVVVCS